ncbi:Os08g0531200 [Oryza sativa Japonica Group]|uniref:Os08g0531200 protein n=1 Tax=Oryza sativa subsp. japonica TaxID=39947 RepID=C7J5M0_ORYSJ|nr:Os08g0531200 [Oryza sativa Japonica Group]|eukprot:NP_001175666.1 Os08g0531200 [Oryza sativa Japonica Group]
MRLLLLLMTNTFPQGEVTKKLFYIIVKVGVPTLIGVSHILSQEMINVLP